jgi:predicted PurR-regulated permease PerM
MNENENLLGFARRALVAVFIAVLVVLLALAIAFAADVFLLVFAGILLAVFLRGMADWLSKHTRFPAGWSLFLLLLALLLVIGTGAWFVGGQVAWQVDRLSEELPRSLEKLRERIQGIPWARRIADEVPSFNQLTSNRADWFSRLTGAFSGTLGVLANVIVVVFIGLYGAIDPGTYQRGLVRLVPLQNRPRAWEVLAAVGTALRGWLVGRVFSMLVVGIATTIGLWLLGIPLALALGLLAAVFGFVPYVGPLVAAVPAILLALMTGPQLAIYVALLYLSIQTVEAYVLTPLVDQRVVQLPPALTITSMLLLGLLVGGLGLTLAAPLTATALVLIKLLYVEDTLGDSCDIPLGDHRSAPPS